jgi:hypothetical protein
MEKLVRSLEIAKCTQAGQQESTATQHNKCWTMDNRAEEKCWTIRGEMLDNGQQRRGEMLDNGQQSRGEMLDN